MLVKLILVQGDPLQPMGSDTPPIGVDEGLGNERGILMWESIVFKHLREERGQSADFDGHMVSHGGNSIAGEKWRG